MKTIGVARLKANLSRYLHIVKHGQEVVVTDRGVPIAKIVPLAPSEHEESRRERLVKAGLLRPGSGRARFARFKAPKGPREGYGVLKALLEEREGSR
jgi:prevent-host-death family protein